MNFIVGETLKGIRRTIGTAQKGKNPLLADDIRGIITASANEATSRSRFSVTRYELECLNNRPTNRIFHFHHPRRPYPLR
jgi:hypothetical protein